MTWHLMGVSPNKTLSHLLYFLGSIFRSHETIWKGSSVEQDGATRRKLVRLAQFADGHRNCSCCGVKYHQMSFSRQKPVDAYWNMQEHQGGTGGKPIEINWDTALQRYFPSVWHNCELIHAFIFSTLLTAPFWFSTVCYRVLRTIEIIHDPIHLGEKTPGLWWSGFVFGVTAQGYRMLVTWHVFNEAAAVVKKSLWHLCKSQWRGENLLTTCSDELPIKDVASLAVGKSTTALMFRVLLCSFHAIFVLQLMLVL